VLRCGGVGITALRGYAYENHGMCAYHPATMTVARSHFAALRAGTRDFPELVASFVLLGMPARFMQPAYRRVG
jgi:hypothetical protein